MKNIFIKILSVILVISFVFPVTVNATETDEVTRVSVTINGDAKTSRGFCWYTENDARSDVQVTTSFGSLENVSVVSGESYASMDKYVHKVTVTNLSPGRTYKYRVGDSVTGVWSEVGYFTTPSSYSNSADFIVYADVQASNDENFKSAANVLNSAVETMPGYDFAINLGDFVNDCTNEEWDGYFNNFSFMNMNTTLVPVAGNHEGNLQWNKFNNMFNLGAAEGSMTVTGCYYSFDWGDAHFAVLNTNDMYPMSIAQINWLKNDMNASDAQWKIVLMHRALYSAGKNINKPDTVVMRNTLLPVIDELGIDVVFAGHDHMYYRSESVMGEQVQSYETSKEFWNFEYTNFAVNPQGTTHILPSTAGTKRYSVNENAMPPILDCAALARDTQDGGVYATVSLDDDHFVYKAYMVDDETGEQTLIDSYAIKKTDREALNENYVELPTEFGMTVEEQLTSVAEQTGKMVKSYINLLYGIVK